MYLITLCSCATVRTTKHGYSIKGEVSKTVLLDKNLNGKSKISGMVYSRDSNTFLSSANVLANSELGTVTNNNGEFELELPAGIYEIHADYVGHSALKISKLELLPNQHVILIFELGTVVIY